MTVYEGGKKKRSRAKPDLSPIDWDTLDAQLKRATNRTDLLEPYDFGRLAFSISNENRHPSTGETLPAPPSLRNFLYQVFVEIAQGIDPAEALRMKPKGRKKKWSTHDKVMACQGINRMISAGFGVKSACEESAKWINETFSSFRSHEEKFQAYKTWPAWHSFYGRTVKWQTLRDWYNDYSPIAMGARLKEEEKVKD